MQLMNATKKVSRNAFDDLLLIVKALYLFLLVAIVAPYK